MNILSVLPFQFQIAALLQMGGGRAASSQRERLEQSLEQSRSEVHMLTEKIKRLEKSKVHSHRHDLKLKTLATIGNYQRPVSQMLDFETSNSKSEVSKSNSRKITSFLKTTSLQRAPSHNVLYYQPLPITRYQVRFYANNYFE